MKIMCKSEVWSELAATGKAFVAWGWEAPDADGFRKHRTQPFGEAGSELGLMTEYMNNVYLRRDAKPHLAVMADQRMPNGLGTEILWHFSNTVDQVMFDLIKAWEHGRDIGTCVQCGNVFIPDRNRKAKFCSPRCRTHWHRQGAA